MECIKGIKSKVCKSLLQEQPEPAICQVIPGETPTERRRGQYTKLIVGVVYKYNSKRTNLGVTIYYDVLCMNRLADLEIFMPLCHKICEKICLVIFYL